MKRREALGYILGTGWAWAAARCIADNARTTAMLKITPSGELHRDGKPFRALGVNYFDCFLRLLKNPDPTSVERGFEVLSRHGIAFVRFCATGFWPVDMELYGKDRDEYFRRFDRVVRLAEEHHLGLVPSLFWATFTVPDLVDEPVRAWGDPKSRTHRWMREYVKEVVSRYANSPAIWLWEFGNQYNLCVDLPNAADVRPPVAPWWGTPMRRSAADDLTTAHLQTALAEFVRAIRAHDPHRPISSGHSIPRPTAWHQWRFGRWTRDRREEFEEIVEAHHPPGVNVISAHLYAEANWERLPWLDEVSRKLGRALFIGEFGISPSELRDERTQFAVQLERLRNSRVSLAAVWVFDYARHEATHNINPGGPRAWMLDMLKEESRRWAELSQRPLS